MIGLALDIDWRVLAPPLLLLVVASVGVIAALFIRGSRPNAALALAGVIGAGILNALLLEDARTGVTLSAFGLRYLADAPAVALNFVILFGALMAILVSYDYLERARLEHPEYYPLMLLSAAGAMVMVAAGDLITLILGLEIMSLAVYALTAWRQESREGEEAGMKYFLLGAFASAFFVYGIALMYGATGQFTYAGIAEALVAADPAVGWGGAGLLATIGGLLLLGALGFKAALAPFHQWAPDVYTGAPTSVVTFMSVVVKTAAIAALVRLFATVFPAVDPILFGALAALVLFTLVVANLGALMQSSVKRLLGFSAVAHSGYLGLAILSAGRLGTEAATFYLLSYALMSAGAFAVLSLVADENDRNDTFDRFAGLGRTNPFLAASMTLFMLGLAGIPLTAGFVGKVLVFYAAIEAGYVALAVLAIVTSIITVWYYFRLVSAMYFRQAEESTPVFGSVATRVGIGIAALGTLVFGLVPTFWTDFVGMGGTLLGGP